MIIAKILCVDFDGVLHSYTSGWQGANVINDPPVRGAIDWLIAVHQNPEYSIAIYSSRSCQKGGVNTMRAWLREWLQNRADIADQIDFPTEKPPAYLTIDDRAICFRGTFPSVLEMDNFKPWNK